MNYPEIKQECIKLTQPFYHWIRKNEEDEQSMLAAAVVLDDMLTRVNRFISKIDKKKKEEAR